MQKPKAWLLFAQDDLAAAKLLVSGQLITIASYHTQQCGEKALKAYLYFKRESLLKTHDLVELTKRCITFDSDFQQLLLLGAKLNPYVMIGRYPQDNNKGPTKEEVSQAIQESQVILSFIEQKIR